MGWATHARSQSRFHEIFSCPFVHFVVQKEFLMLPADALQKKNAAGDFFRVQFPKIGSLCPRTRGSSGVGGKQKSQPGRLRYFLNLHPETLLGLLYLFLETAPFFHPASFATKKQVLYYYSYF